MTWVWNVAEKLIEKAAWTVTSADKAYAWLREQGYDVRRADVREAWKAYNEKTFYEGPISQWDPSRKIPKAWIGERETKEFGGYMQMFKVQFYDPSTRKIEEQVWSHVTDEPVPFSDLIPELESDLELYSASFGTKVVEYRPSGIVHMVPKGKS